MFQTSSSPKLPSEYRHQEFRTRVGTLSIQQYTDLQTCQLFIDYILLFGRALEIEVFQATYSPNPPSEWTRQNLNILRAAVQRLSTEF